MRRIGILSAILAGALLLPVAAAQADHRHYGHSGNHSGVVVSIGGGYYPYYARPSYQPYYGASYYSPDYAGYYYYPSSGYYYYPSTRVYYDSPSIGFYYRH